MTNAIVIYTSMLLENFLVKEGFHLLIQRTWKWIWKKGSKGNCICIFYEVMKKVAIRSERKSNKHYS